MENSPVRPGAEPFYIERPGDTACLLVHGFMGSPYEVRPIADRLAAAGVTAMGIRLPGHGTTSGDMGHYGYADWLSAADGALASLLAQRRNVFVAGFSMGGTIALNLATRRSHHPRLRGIVTICSPIDFMPRHLGWRSMAEVAYRWAYDGPTQRLTARNMSNLGRQDNSRQFAPRAFVELLALLRETRARLGRVTVPLLVYASRQDPGHPAVPRARHLRRRAQRG